MNTIPSELEKLKAAAANGQKICPKTGCVAGGKPQDIETMFGWRTVNGKKVAQSYCTHCRKNKPVMEVQQASSTPLLDGLLSTGFGGENISKIVQDSMQPVTPLVAREGYQLPASEGAVPIENFVKDQHDPGHSFKVIEQFAKQKLGLFEHAITPNHAATILHLITGCAKRWRDDDDDVDSKFSLIIRGEASLRSIPAFMHWQMPEWSSYNGYSRHDLPGDDKCTDERRLANALLRWGLALVAWCDEEEIARADIERRMKEREKKEKEKRAAALAKRKAAKAKGGKSKAYDPADDDEEEDDEELEDE